MKPLGNEPALVTSFINAVLGLVVTLNVGLTSDQAGALTVVVTAVFGVIAAVLTRPIAPTVFTTLVTAGADALSAFHFSISADKVAAVNAIVVTGLMLITRGHVAPVALGKAPAQS